MSAVPQIADLIREASEGRTDVPQPGPSPVSAEDFAAWCEHPVTRFVAASHELMADLQRAAWMESSWVMGIAGEAALGQLRARADTFRAFTQSTWADHAARLAEKGDPQWWRYVQELAKAHAAKGEED